MSNSGRTTGELTYQSQTATSLPTFLGVQLDTRLTLYNMVWSPFMGTAWMHEFRPNRSLAASFESVPGTLFRGRQRARLERRIGQCRLAARAQSICAAVRQLRRRVCQQRAKLRGTWRDQIQLVKASAADL